MTRAGIELFSEGKQPLTWPVRPCCRVLGENGCPDRLLRIYGVIPAPADLTVDGRDKDSLPTTATLSLLRTDPQNLRSGQTKATALSLHG